MAGKSKTKIAGWVLSGLLAMFMVFSSYGKFFEFPGKAEMFEDYGITTRIATYIGVVEVALAVLFLVPRAAFVAAILLASYLGGAVWTHVRAEEPFWFPIVVGVLFWVALGLRDKRVFRLAMGG